MRIKSAARRRATVLSFACLVLFGSLWRVSPRKVYGALHVFEERRGYDFTDKEHQESYVRGDPRTHQHENFSSHKTVGGLTQGLLLSAPISSPSRTFDARSVTGNPALIHSRHVNEEVSRPPTDAARHKMYTNHWHNYELTETELFSARAELCSIASDLSGTSVQEVKTDKLQLLSRDDLKYCDSHSQVDALKNGKYCSDALEIFQSTYPYERVLISFGDVTPETTNLPFFIKSRKINATRNGVLWPLNTKRHFGKLKDVSLHDIPWDDKSSRVVWRGADTGKGLRAKAVEGMFDKLNEDIDVALTIVLEYGRKSLTRPMLSMQELLRHKYLLSLEGNDVASGLKWMLLSNSVVFMPTPSYESWALESFLIPYIHYVPVAADLSNLLEQLVWAKENDEVCQNISQAATRFMRKFVGYSGDDIAEQDVHIKKQVISTVATVMDQILGTGSSQSCAINEILQPNISAVIRLPVKRTTPVDFGCGSYALPAAGEEDIVPLILSRFPKHHRGTFVEMGANNGLNSNSLQLEKNGWRGVCIEPSPSNFRLLKMNRPQCTCMQLLVSGKFQGEEILFRELGGDLCGHSGLIHSRSDENWKDLLQRHPTARFFDHRIRTERLTNIPTVTSKRVDVFVLDIEGSEMDVLEDVEWHKIRVNTWVIESNKLDRNELEAKLGAQGYSCMHLKVNSICETSAPLSQH